MLGAGECWSNAPLPHDLQCEEDGFAAVGKPTDGISLEYGRSTVRSVEARAAPQTHEAGL
jgi:hypothetical protein